MSEIKKICNCKCSEETKDLIIYYSKIILEHSKLMIEYSLKIEKILIRLNDIENNIIKSEK